MLRQQRSAHRPHKAAAPGGPRRCTSRSRRHADFPAPDDLPATVTVWRGGDVPLARLRRGLAWTLDRDIACWFACRFTPPRPLVVSAAVPRAAILARFTDRDEDEVVVFDPGEVVVDGAPDDWRGACEVQRAQREAEHRRRLAVIAPAPRWVAGGAPAGSAAKGSARGPQAWGGAADRPRGGAMESV
jgi:hypothetical protein